MIGIKDNAEVKVWTNADWSQNGYRLAHSEHSSIDALWNTLKMRAMDPMPSELNNQLSKMRPFEF